MDKTAISMPIIKPIDLSRQSQVVSHTHHYIGVASKIFGRPFAEIPVSFKLTGRAAGMYHVQRNKRFIRYNPYIFAKYFSDNLHNTVAHEVAHYIADMLYGIKNIKPHGTQWRTIMGQFGVEPQVTCRYDLEGIPQRQHRRFAYQCQCRQYAISTRRHNMILRGQRHYHCPTCNGTIHYAGD